MAAQSFEGYEIEDPLLRAYARDLHSLRRCLVELRTLASFLGQQSAAGESLSQSLETEIEDWKRIAGELSDEGNPDRQQRLANGERSFESIKILDARNIGRVRPRLLFSYARDSGIGGDTYSKIASSKEVKAAKEAKP